MAMVDAPEEVAQAALRRQALRKAMHANSGTLYGIVDAAIDDGLHDVLQAEPESSEVTCLYDGAPAIRYARYAPYLMKLHDGSALFERWLNEGWTAHWGIFISSPAAPADIKRHLKKFLQATDPHKRTVWVRFYDPRVLPNWLQGLHPGHLADWFGGGLITCCATSRNPDIWASYPITGGFHRLTTTAALDSRLIVIQTP